MSTSQTKVEPLGWTDLPDRHRLGFGSNKRKRNLEDVSKALKTADVEGFEKGDLDWENQVNSVIGLNSEDIQSRQEAIQEVQEELDEEREAIDQTKDFFDEAAELAEREVREIRQELGVEEAREQDWYSAEEVIQIDGFHYVHAQSWFPVLEKTDEVEFDDDLQRISERALEANHAADAYQIDKETYEEITSDLKKPLQNFIAVGKLGENNEYRQKAEKELKNLLTDWITSEEAEEYIEKLDSNLDWRTAERYVDLDELGEETVEKLKQNLNIDKEYEDIDEEIILRYRLSQELTSGRIKEETVKEQFSESVVSDLREMQKNLKNKSRGRLIDALSKPEKTEFSQVTSIDYRIKKWSWVASYLQNNMEDAYGNNEVQTVHADFSRTASSIREYSKSETFVSKNFLSHIENLGVSKPDIRYWQIQKPVLRPDFPLDATQQGMLYASLTQGKTRVDLKQDRHNANLSYEFSNGNNSVIRAKALDNLFGDKGVGDNEPELSEEDYNGESEIFSENHHDELSTKMSTVLPCSLDFIRQEISDDPESFLEDEKFAEGYISQSIWERGYVKNDGVIRFSPKDYESFSQALETLNVNHNKYNSDSSSRTTVAIPNREVCDLKVLEEFREAYRQFND